MSSADKIVEALLGGGEDPKDFLNRQEGDVDPEKIKEELASLGIPLENFDGIEVYGMIEDEDNLSRVDGDSPAVNRYGVSLHRHGGGLFDVGEYRFPEHARRAAEILKSLLPYITIFYDEIS
jgi:hypothetical protein